jgi:hypothetical protein
VSVLLFLIFFLYFSFVRETATSYTEELQTLKGVEKELGRWRYPQFREYLILPVIFFGVKLIKTSRNNGCVFLHITFRIVFIPALKGRTEEKAEKTGL